MFSNNTSKASKYCSWAFLWCSFPAVLHLYLCKFQFSYWCFMSHLQVFRSKYIALVDKVPFLLYKCIQFLYTSYFHLLNEAPVFFSLHLDSVINHSCLLWSNIFLFAFKLTCSFSQDQVCNLSTVTLLLLSFVFIFFAFWNGMFYFLQQNIF